MLDAGRILEIADILDLGAFHSLSARQLCGLADELRAHAKAITKAPTPVAAIKKPRTIKDVEFATAEDGDPFAIEPVPVKTIPKPVKADPKPVKTTPKPVKTARKTHKLAVNPAHKRFSDEFESFWRRYPRKVGKSAAFEFWTTIEKSDAGLIDYALGEFIRECRSIDDPSFIPHARTWLKNRLEDYRERYDAGKLPPEKEVADEPRRVSVNRDDQPFDLSKTAWPQGLGDLLTYATKRTKIVAAENAEFLSGAHPDRADAVREVFRLQLAIWLASGAWPSNLPSPLNIATGWLAPDAKRAVVVASEIGRVRSGREIDGAKIGAGEFKRVAEFVAAQ